jgi:hypothetical protein
MSDGNENWDNTVQREARRFTYPHTLDIAELVRARLQARPTQALRRWRLAQVTALALLAVCMLLAVPPIRALVWSVLRIGAVEVLPAASDVPNEPDTPDFGTPVSLEQAQRRIGQAFPLPPAPLYANPQVFMPHVDLTAFHLVYRDAGGEIMLVYTVIRDDLMQKLYPDSAAIVEARVGEADAIWLTQPHLLQSDPAGMDTLFARRYVASNVLLWTDGALTYRLETNLALPEAVALAEAMS